jgi:hypothetical protein
MFTGKQVPKKKKYQQQQQIIAKNNTDTYNGYAVHGEQWICLGMV